MPDNVESTTPLPLIVGVNGSKNWSDHHLEYMKMFRDMGFATFELQSFNSRNVRSTVGAVSYTHLTLPTILLV